MEVIVVLRRVVRAVRSTSERRVERDWRSEGESWCWFDWGWELEMLETGLESGCRIDDIVVWDGDVFGGTVFDGQSGFGLETGTTTTMNFRVRHKR
jgi:hypothetical protein